MIYILIVLAIFTAIFVGMGIVVARAPLGYEDENGFHLGTPGG